jgi:Lon protease-like protein
MLPATLPLFPLPDAVLFPGVFLPLHVFEPRYRRMVADALAGERLIGMVLLRPGWEPDYEGRPPVFETGCAGVITHAEQLPDGRYNLVLKGLSRFRVLDEDRSRPYRVGRVEGLAEAAAGPMRESLREGRLRLELLVAATVERSDRRLPTNLEDDEVVNALSQYLDLEPIERQALLECAGPLPRCHLLLELLGMRTMASRGPSGSPLVH